MNHTMKGDLNMSWITNLKERRQERKDPYDKEELRLRMMICETDPFDDRYDQLQKKLQNNIRMHGESKENKRKLAKADRGNVLIKILGIGGAIAGGFMIGKFEKEGLTYTGEKRSYMDAISRAFGNMFIHKG